MQACKLIPYILIVFLSNYAYAEDPATSQTTIELNYRLFSPEILFQQDGDTVFISPEEPGQPGFRVSRGNLSLSVNQSLLSKGSQSGGFDVAYSWGNSFVQAYHVWAKGYKAQLNPNSDSKNDLGVREDMKGMSSGLLFLKGSEESSSFSMMTNHGPRDLKTVSTPLQYIYQVLLDRTVFEDSSPLVAGQTALKKERTSLFPGLGAMISESTSTGYVFTSCSLGVGVIKETMAHTTGNSEEKTDGGFALSCLLKLVLQQSQANIEASDSRWYGGMAGNVQMVQPFDKKLFAQRLFLVGAFIGTQF